MDQQVRSTARSPTLPPCRGIFTDSGLQPRPPWFLELRSYLSFEGVSHKRVMCSGVRVQVRSANGSVQVGRRSQVVNSFASSSSSSGSGSGSGSYVADLAGLWAAWIDLVLGFLQKIIYFLLAMTD